MRIRINKGLDLPIDGKPRQVIEDKPVSKVAVLGSDYVDLRPHLAVEVGQQVKRGEVLFTDERLPGVNYTAPAGGVVTAIHRGERRALLSVVIDVDDHEQIVKYPAYTSAEISELGEQAVRENLINSGLWTALRTRPFNKAPAPDSVPHAIFINAMDTRPLAPDPQVVLKEQSDAFADGLRALSRLGAGQLFLCASPATNGSFSALTSELNQLVVALFDGPHPAGLPGTHIHFLDPVSLNKTVWHVNYQDVIAMGKLFTTGELFVERVVSLAGPQVKRPRLLRTRLGAFVHDMVREELKSGENRIISGSVLHGHAAVDALAFLGRYHLQVSVISEGREQEFMGWLRPGKNKFSLLNIFTSRFMPRKQFAMTTTSGGDQRAMVPVGTYEEVMPLDILPTLLLRALIVDDSETAHALGCLELDEEDLALCTYVCPGKYDYGPLLHRCLERIEKEG